MAEKAQKIILFPFMAQGHIIPFLALALHLEKTRKNIAVTFVNTPLNIAKLRPSLPSSSSIHLLEIPFDSAAHGLPPAAENCHVLPYPLVIRLIQASLSLRDPFRDLVERHTAAGDPVCLIGDIFFGWMAGVAVELDVFHAVFSGSGGFGFACYYSMWTNLPQTETSEETEEFTLPDFPEASRIHMTQLPLNMLQANGTDDWSVFQHKNLPEYSKSGGLLFNTAEELDELGLMYFKRKLGKPVWPIGPILLPNQNRSKYGSANTESGICSESCKKWLDSKPDKSVLYVSFGSMNTISLNQMMELAKALETSGKNFVWVVRPPIESDINSEFKPSEFLPPGFEERTRTEDRGLLVHKWAPQVEILSHRAVSVFLSHCGWNSVLESLSNGVPLLGWAMAAEQFFNVKFLVEEIGVCVEVARGNRCEVSHGDLVEKIELVMGESEKGKEMRERGYRVRELIKNALKDEEGFGGSSVRTMDEFFTTAAASQARNNFMKHHNDAV